MVATQATLLEARCPLCGELVLTVGRGGHVLQGALHAAPLFTERLSWQGYLLCDECGRLAELPPGMSLN